MAVVKKLLPIKYPDLNLNIEAILNWDLWPTLLKIEGKYLIVQIKSNYIKLYVVKHSKTSTCDQDICHIAYVIVDNICTSVLDGSITICDLEMVKEKQSSMEKLYAAISHDKKLGAFNATLNSHLKKYTTYASQQAKLSVLVQNLPSANISGQSVIMYS